MFLLFSACEVGPLSVVTSLTTTHSLSIRWEVSNSNACLNVKLCISPVDDICQIVRGESGINQFRNLTPGQTYTASIQATGTPKVFSEPATVGKYKNTCVTSQ